MKKKLSFLILLIGILSFAQVGINTISPTNTLDINGSLRIRRIDSITVLPKYIIASNDNGVIQKINLSKITSSSPEAIGKKIFAVITKNSRQYLSQKGTDYSTNFDGTIKGINVHKIIISNSNNHINLPSNKTFKITGFIGVAGANSSGTSNKFPGYITSTFITGGGTKTIVSTIGYTESSTEAYDDGGVTNPIIILTTDETDNNYVELQVRFGGTNSGNDGYYLSGAPTRNTLGTYVLLEEM